MEQLFEWFVLLGLACLFFPPLGAIIVLFLIYTPIGICKLIKSIRTAKWEPVDPLDQRQKLLDALEKRDQAQFHYRDQ